MSHRSLTDAALDHGGSVDGRVKVAAQAHRESGDKWHVLRVESSWNQEWQIGWVCCSLAQKSSVQMKGSLFGNQSPTVWRRVKTKGEKPEFRTKFFFRFYLFSLPNVLFSLRTMIINLQRELYHIWILRVPEDILLQVTLAAFGYQEETYRELKMCLRV